jgi:pyruvate,water dikinase
VQLEFDTPVDPDYPVYTRANAGEVLPGIVAPLGWDLIGRPAEAGFRRSLTQDLGALSIPPDREFLIVGRFAGRFLLNLSALRTAGEHLPGTSAAAVDSQYLGDASQYGLPAYQASRRERLWYVRSTPSVLRSAATIGRRIVRERAAVEKLVRDNRAFLTAHPADADVVERLRAQQPHFTRAFATHITARALSSPAVELLQRTLRRVGAPDDLLLRLLADLPGLESSQPGLELRRIASGIGGPLRKAIPAGMTFDELRESPLDGAARAAADMRRFFERFGHRGLNEWNPTVPAWEQQPDDAMALLASALAAGDAESGDARRHTFAEAEAELAKLATGRRGRVAKILVRNARQALVRGEMTKGTGVRVSNEMRRLLWVLRGRFAARIPPDDLSLLTLAELDRVALGGSITADTIDRRRREIAAAEEIDVPEVIVGEARVVPRAAPVTSGSASELTGLAGSAGVVRGSARVMDDPFGPFEPGEILVAAVTDTAWTPLFLSAAAVVTDVGGPLSHATIVARDLGIPAVVNTKTGTSEIATGDLLEVDGGSGVVRILERSTPGG